MNQHEKINYVELPATDIEANKHFFADVFNWQFEDFGPEYVAFHNAGIEGGFFKSQEQSRTANGAALIVFYSNELELTLKKIEQAGGEILQPIYEFPGGRRFHFADPSGNEFAVWSEPA